jgi:hypothetical protein
MFQAKAVEKIKTYILCSITFSQKSCRLWDNVEKFCGATEATDDNILRRMRFVCWITKATDTHSEYVILIAFPLQQWLRERASILRLYVHCLSCFLTDTESVYCAVRAECLNLFQVNRSLHQSSKVFWFRTLIITNVVSLAEPQPLVSSVIYCLKN